MFTVEDINEAVDEMISNHCDYCHCCDICDHPDYCSQLQPIKEWKQELIEAIS